MSLVGDDGNEFLIITHDLHEPAVSKNNREKRRGSEPVRCDGYLAKSCRLVQLDFNGVVPSGTYLENSKWSNPLLASVRSNIMPSSIVSRFPSDEWWKERITSFFFLAKDHYRWWAVRGRRARFLLIVNECSIVHMRCQVAYATLILRDRLTEWKYDQRKPVVYE